ncbi:MAG: hypothetical protein IPF99_38500 [Deltaproteobacteria bacterium]|nr:hypothetical protein [Deltaproteobacteria bacterium]
MIRGLGDDDLWHAVVDPDPANPRRRTLTVWGQGAVNVNTANAQTLLALVCAYSPDAPQCQDLSQASAFITTITMVQALTLSMGIPLFSSPSNFVGTLQGRPPLGTMLTQLGMRPFVVRDVSGLERSVTVESKVFSVYAEAQVGAAHVRVHAVIDMRPQPELPSTFMRAAGMNIATTSQGGLGVAGAGRHCDLLAGRLRTETDGTLPGHRGHGVAVEGRGLEDRVQEAAPGDRVRSQPPARSRRAAGGHAGARIAGAGLPPAPPRGPAAELDGVYASLPGHEASIRAISLPRAVWKRGEKALLAELEGAVPFDVDDAVVDAQVTAPGDPVPLLAVAAIRDRVKNYLDGMILGGLEPRELGVSPMALGELAAEIPELAVPGPVLLVYAQDSRAEVAVLRGGVTVFARTVTALTTPAARARAMRQSVAAWAAADGPPIERAYLCGLEAQWTQQPVLEATLLPTELVMPLPSGAIQLGPLAGETAFWEAPIPVALAARGPRARQADRLPQGPPRGVGRRAGAPRAGALPPRGAAAMVVISGRWRRGRATRASPRSATDCKRPFAR